VSNVPPRNSAGPFRTLPWSSPIAPKDNHLLATLPDVDFERIAPHLKSFPMRLGDVLYGPGDELQHAYFPTTAVVSVLYVTQSGASAEIASVGNEGLLGISLLLGGSSTLNSAVVQTAGVSYCLDANVLQQEFKRGGNTRRLLLRYTQALVTQIGQTAVCNRHHSIEQQLCRWLLLTLDRLPSNQVVVTHELVAGLFGVRRESITAAAGNLQRAGVLSYHRGHIAVIARAGLEAGTCECYAVVKQEFRRLLGHGS
jgi:CRP-like cAMP-binding protein